MRLRVLIVDDHAGFRRLARQLVEAAGQEVVGEASDGSSALRIAAELGPDLVLLDVVLPDLSGTEVAELLDSQGSQAEVLLISSRSADDLPAVPGNGRRFARKDELSVELLREVAGVVE